MALEAGPGQQGLLIPSKVRPGGGGGGGQTRGAYLDYQTTRLFRVIRVARPRGLLLF